MPKDLYLDLLKKVLINNIYRDGGLRYPATAEQASLRREEVPFDGRVRETGRDFPLVAHTMIGLARLDNLQACIEQVIAEQVPGDLIETGVWRGGATILMRGVLKAYDVRDRKVWVADSFEGLPEADAEKYPVDQVMPFHLLNDVLGVPLETVRENFRRYDLLDEQVEFLPGYFRDTLPDAPIKELAVLRLDGDMYESTMDALVHLYPRLAVGGFLIVDDYRQVPTCRLAVSDYRKRHAIDEPIVQIDGAGVYWRKTR
ncbi:TylF/MycF family methyltransferase [Nonomuraea sp. NPDC003709]|uniref:TylF/MycF family methyltransferase n=1 Tax=Nonomuraea sp. NPDC003709 TaxID=3154450 RepID=UPI0033B70E94